MKQFNSSIKWSKYQVQMLSFLIIRIKLSTSENDFLTKTLSIFIIVQRTSNILNQFLIKSALMLRNLLRLFVRHSIFLQFIQKILSLSMTKNQQSLCLLGFLLILSILIPSSCSIRDQNYISFKNNKILALSISHIGIADTLVNQNKQNSQNILWLSNTQQYIKLQVPLLQYNQKKKVERLIPHNYTEYFPIVYSNLIKKGYVKPLIKDLQEINSKQKLFVKGYKYHKPTYHDQNTDEIFLQVQHFLQSLIKENNLGILNLRMQDSFDLQIQFTPQSGTFKVRSLKIKYLFATVQNDTIPSQILQLASKKIFSHQQFLSKQKDGIVQRKLSGKGLHQWVNLTISLDDKTDILITQSKDKCYFQFSDILPESTYIDADQRRDQTTNFEVINVQKPAFASKQYFYRFRIPFTQLQQSGVHKYFYQQPIHFRYPVPSQKQSTKVYLHSIQMAKIVCRQDSQQSTKIYPLLQNNLFDRGIARIPNADSSKSKIVSIVTLAVCLIVVLKITGTLKKGMDQVA